MLHPARPGPEIGLGMRALCLRALCLWALAAFPLGCGSQGALASLDLGTVTVLNQTDVGMAPLVVTAFFLAPVGDPSPGPNRLAQDLQPGGIAIVGLFPAGTYNAVAVLEGGLNINFPAQEVRAGEPTNFVIPGS